VTIVNQDQLLKDLELSHVIHANQEPALKNMAKMFVMFALLVLMQLDQAPKLVMIALSDITLTNMQLNAHLAHQVNTLNLLDHHHAMIAQ